MAKKPKGPISRKPGTKKPRLVNPTTKTISLLEKKLVQIKKDLDIVTKTISILRSKTMATPKPKRANLRKAAKPKAKFILASFESPKKLKCSRDARKELKTSFNIDPQTVLTLKRTGKTTFICLVKEKAVKKCGKSAASNATLKLLDTESTNEMMPVL